ncbi:hypothetical protein [Sphingomonas montana]|uniref:hypothetical protein n=1 Tax=Sphingomonas montana TaxID=1843236 RepID=UPI00096EF0E4|nr:hypothetical protein [Sphingomonas montana]
MTTPLAEVARLTIAGREEYARIVGSGDAAAVLLVPPLFGEMNRCRRLMVDVMTELATLGRGSALPDLPGTGESLMPFGAVTLDDWRAMVAACAALLHAATGRTVMIASLRGGALLDDAPDPVDVAGRWRMTPVEGATVLRELGRAQRLAGTSGPPLSGAVFAGTPLAPGLAGPLGSARPQGSARIVRLGEDGKNADERLTGSPLWRRAEPGRDLAMALAIARDIDRTAATCANS